MRDCCVTVRRSYASMRIVAKTSPNSRIDTTPVVASLQPLGADYHRDNDPQGEPVLFDAPDPSDVVAAVAKAARGQPHFLLIGQSDQTAHQRVDQLGDLVVPYPKR